MDDQSTTTTKTSIVEKFPWEFSIKVPIPSFRDAEIILSSISVEKELHPHHISRAARIISEDDSVFITVDFHSSDLRHLRISVNSFILKLCLGIETIATFGYTSEDELINHPDILPDCAMKI